MVYRNPTGEFRHVPRIIKTGWFKREVVLVLQQKYHHKGDYFSPDSAGGVTTDVDHTQWEDCKEITNLFELSETTVV